MSQSYFYPPAAEPVLRQCLVKHSQVLGGNLDGSVDFALREEEQVFCLVVFDYFEANLVEQGCCHSACRCLGSAARAAVSRLATSSTSRLVRSERFAWLSRDDEVNSVRIARLKH